MGFCPDEVNAGAQITFIAQNPGENEEEKGRPLIGRSGMMVVGNLQKYGLRREDANYLNVLKCRWQHENELPGGAEQAGAVDHCTSRFLIPKLPMSNVYVPVGELALNTSTGLAGIEAWRGSVFKPTSGILKGRKVVPTIHPSYLFKRPALRTASKRDFSIIYLESQSSHSRTTYVDSPLLNVSPQDFLYNLRDLNAKKRRIVVDIETDQRKPIEATLKIIGVGWSKQDAMNVVFQGDDPLCQKILKVLEEYTGDLVSASSFDFTVLTRYGVKFRSENLHDLILLHSRYDIELPHTVEFIASTWTDRPYWKWMGTDDPLYNWLDCVGEWEAFDRLSRYVIANDPNVWKTYNEDRKMLKVQIALHLNGLPLDPKVFNDEKKWYTARADELEATIKERLNAVHEAKEMPEPCPKHPRYTGKTPPQLRKGETEVCEHCILVRNAAEDAKPLKLTSRVQMRERLEEQDIEIPVSRKTGEWSLDKGAIAKIIRDNTENPVVDALAQYEAFKAMNTVLTRYFKEMKTTKATGRVHSLYSLHSAKHRTSCKNPNVQQMKKPEEE